MTGQAAPRAGAGTPAASPVDPEAAGGGATAPAAASPAPPGPSDPPAEPVALRPSGRPAPAPLPARPRKRLSRAALLLYSLSLALGLGLGSAWWAVGGQYPVVGGVQVGPWKTWPRIGARDADPYARAVVARTSGIPLGAGEGITFVAEADDAGRPLDSSCAYRVGSVTPQTRYWTITVYDSAGRPAQSELGRAGFTSAEVLRAPDGGFTLELSRDAVPGNWLPLPREGRFSLILRLYESPVAVGTAALEARTVPSIRIVECPR